MPFDVFVKNVPSVLLLIQLDSFVETLDGSLVVPWISRCSCSFQSHLKEIISHIKQLILPSQVKMELSYHGCYSYTKQHYDSSNPMRCDWVFSFPKWGKTSRNRLERHHHKKYHHISTKRDLGGGRIVEQEGIVTGPFFDSGNLHCAIADVLCNMFLPIPSHVFSTKHKNISFRNISLVRFYPIIGTLTWYFRIRDFGLMTLMTGILQLYRSEWARLWTNGLLLAEGRTEWCYHHFSWCSSHSTHCLTFPGWYPHQKSGMLFRQPLKIIILSWNSWKLALVQKIMAGKGWDSRIVLKLSIHVNPAPTPFATTFYSTT